MFQDDPDQKSRNQGSARCSAKYAQLKRLSQMMSDEVDGDDEAGVGDDEVVEL